jgi:hypothetical protein
MSLWLLCLLSAIDILTEGFVSFNNPRVFLTDLPQTLLIQDVYPRMLIDRDKPL